MNQEGTQVDHCASESDNPPCPTCGCTAVLVEGAGADCGLQLER